MAYRRKKIQNDTSSRGRRADGDQILCSDQRPGRDTRIYRRNSGYGVSDSYMRQDEFGRPQGRRTEEDLRQRAGERYEAGRPYGSADPYEDGPDSYGRESGRAAASQHEREGRARRPRWEDDPYDDRYTGSYEDFEEDRPGRRRQRRTDSSSFREEIPEYPGSRDRRAAVLRQEERAQRAERKERKRKAPKKRDGKKGFVLKLILLIIAALVLAVFYRFGRIDRVSLGTLMRNEGADAGTGYQNFVIYGVDSREGELTKDAHSDTIVICSISKSSKTARMVSVYRDTYLDNTNGEFRKATECYFFGGPERSINMLNRNLDLDISDYIAVDFNAVVKAVDLIGGVEINVTEDELPYINGYQTENAQVTGAEITPVTQAGYQHLNGIQALAYCRIRYTAGNDFRRTERQRDVLSQIFEKARQQGTAKTLEVANAMLPYISTSFSNAEIMSLASGLSDLTLGDSVGFPFEQQAAEIAAGDCVVPVDLAQNVSELHAFLFDQNNYTPSMTVQEISQTIIENTGIG